MYIASELQKEFETLPGWFDFAMQVFDYRVLLAKKVATRNNLDVRVTFDRIGSINKDDEMLTLCCEFKDDDDIKRIQPK